MEPITLTIQPMNKQNRTTWQRIRVLITLLVLSVIASTVTGLIACSGDTSRRIAHTTVVSTGRVLSQLHREHQRAYTQATDQLRRSIRQQNGSIDDYNRQVLPIDQAFESRSQLIQTIDSHLYTAAELIDASRSGVNPNYRQVAASLLETLERTLESLRQGNALPPVAIPTEVIEVVHSLQVIAAGTTDNNHNNHNNTDGGT